VHPEGMATDPSAETPSVFWERFYEDRDRWSGNPNPALVDEASDLPAGRALDLGCGQGADAIWLAQRGWDVTAVDISRNALERAAEHAQDAGVADIRWERHDLSASVPAGPFELVSACYLQSPVELPRERVLRNAAAAVAPGGRLLVVAHAQMPSWADPAKHPAQPGLDETLASLELPDGAWTVESSREVVHTITSKAGEPGTRSDIVLRIRRG
jgi:SAM-dependent methyltransferase